MAHSAFAKTTLFFTSLFASLVTIASVNAQVYVDDSVKEQAARQGLTKELEAKQRMLAEVQVAPSKIEVRELDGGKIYLAPYVTIDLGERGSQTEWIVNKTPPVFVANVKNAGSIIFSVLPQSGEEMTNELIYQSVVGQFRKKMKTVDASPFRQLSEATGEGSISGQHANGNEIQLYVFLVNQPEFVMLVQGMGESVAKLEDIKRIVHTINLDTVVPTASSSLPESESSIHYGNSRLIVPNPKGLIRGTDDFPKMIAEMNEQAPFKVSEVYVLPAATEASWLMGGLYRNADARVIGSMTAEEVSLMRKDFESAVKQKLSISPQIRLTESLELDDPCAFGFIQQVTLPNKNRIGVSAMLFHDGQLFQFGINSDIGTEADKSWAKETMKDWVRSIQKANSDKKVVSQK